LNSSLSPRFHCFCANSPVIGDGDASRRRVVVVCLSLFSRSACFSSSRGVCSLARRSNARRARRSLYGRMSRVTRPMTNTALVIGPNGGTKKTTPKGARSDKVLIPALLPLAYLSSRNHLEVLILNQIGSNIFALQG
jgi:hypothetical protein